MSRRQNQTLQYTLLREPDSLDDVPYHVIARHAEELHNEVLKVIARLFIEIDILSVSVRSKVLELISSGRFTTDQETTRTFQRTIAEITQLNDAFSKIRFRTTEISKFYFEDRFLLKWWQLSLSIIKQTVEAPRGASTTDDEHRAQIEPLKATIQKYIQVGLNAKAPILKAASQGVLSDEILSGIGDRMDIIDEAATYLHSLSGDLTSAKTWPTILEEVMEVRDKTHSTSSSAQDTSGWTATLSALTGLGTLVSRAPAGLAWYHSDYVPGTTTDADFWWLIQSSIMQILSLFTLSVPIWQGSRLPSQNWFWTWVFIAIAAVATVLAVPAYLYVPVPYSSTLGFVATASQAFVVLQLALAASVKMTGSAKEKKQCSNVLDHREGGIQAICLKYSK